MFEHLGAIRYRVKRKARSLFAHRNPIQPTAQDLNKIRLVIYFDYEREFGNERGELLSDVFREILRILREHEMKSTWNCVGRVAERYPETIDDLISEGHEISCHTFNHVAPLKMPVDDLRHDIQKAKEFFKQEWGIELWGFHSPEDAWSHALLRILIALGFRYDISREFNAAWQSLHWISSGGVIHGQKGKTLRIPSMSDDWMFMSEGKSPAEMLSHWLRYLQPQYAGSCFAIGFHPWVLGMETGRMVAFEDFVKKATSNPGVTVVTGGQLAEMYSQLPVIENKE